MLRVHIISFLFLTFGLSLKAVDTLDLALDKVLSEFELPYIYDSLNTLTPPLLSQMWDTGNRDNEQVFNPYYGQYWSVLIVKNTGGIRSEWILNAKDWPEVIVYREESDGLREWRRTGFRVPYNERDYAFADKNHILLELLPGETRKLIVCLRAGADHWRMPANMNISIIPKSLQDQINHKDELIMGVFGGILLFLFLYNLFIYLSTRDFEYLLFLARILIVGYTINANSGYLVSWLSGFESFPLYKAVVGSILSGLGPIIMIIFTMHFLNTKHNLPFWHRILKWQLWIILFLVVGVNFHYKVFGPIAYLLSMAVVATFIIIGIKSIIKKVPSSWYYVLAYVFSTTAMFVMIFSFMGLVPKNTFTMNYVLPMGYTLELLFFSFALANKINILRRKTESQQLEIIVHLTEKEKLQKGITIELEKKVEERTREINEQKEMIEVERLKSENLLMNILPEEAVLELKEKGRSSPKFHQSVSILFTDFKGFTKISSNISTERLVEELDDLFHHFDEIMESHDVEKIKTIGDAYMSVAGLYNQEENHAHKCIEAGIEIQKYLKIRNAKADIKWEVRIGIHSGSVISGIVGKNKFTFDVWGDSVNIASRLESNSEIGQINISGPSYEFAKDKFECIYRGKIEAKGKGKMDMYFVKFDWE